MRRILVRKIGIIIFSLSMAGLLYGQSSISGSDEDISLSEFRSDIDLYLSRVGELRNEAYRMNETEQVKSFFDTALALGRQFDLLANGFVDDPYGVYSLKIKPLVEMRRDSSYEVSGNSLYRKEKDLYVDHIDKYLDKYILLTDIQIESVLYERKVLSEK